MLRAVLIAGALLAGGYTPTALARDVLLLGGSTFSSASKYYYLGAVIPVQQESLDRDGFLVRLWAAYQDFDYNTTFAGGAAGIPTRVDVDGPVGEIALGYQWFPGKDSRFTAYLGVVQRDLDATPNDPGSKVESEDTGYKLQLEGATRSGKFGLSAIGSYTFEFDDYWGRVRPAWYLGNRLHVGPELVFMGGDKYDKQQLGIFLGGIQLGKQADLEFKVGGEHSSRTGGNTRAYGGISFSVRF
ncbi:MAG: cellulose biosynthesis protein BcsS [Betaproteobacteria bacterium]|nr:cellulose biosynthesis protein BcsS [Betaproteobacteria bacterium]